MLKRRFLQLISVRLSSSCCKSNSDALKPIQLSELNYKQHLLVLGPAAPWPKSPMQTDDFLAKLCTETAILSNLKITASSHRSFFAVDSADSRDILVFPEMLKFHSVAASKFDILVKHLVEARLGVLNPSDSPAATNVLQISKLDRNLHIVVCTHEARDSRCGERGGMLLNALKRFGCSHSLAAYDSTHVGGHDYAANMIVYPSGDWYGNLAQTPAEADAQVKMIVEAVEKGEIVWEFWRGRIGVSLETMEKMRNLKTLNVQGTGCGSKVLKKDSSKSDTQHDPVKNQTAQTIKVTYKLKNGQEIKVDAPLTEFTPKDPENPYFRNDDKSPNSISLFDDAYAPSESHSKQNNLIEFTFVFGKDKEMRQVVKGNLGDRVLDIAKDANIPTIEGVCGGNMECATCHVIVDKEHFDNLPKASEGEEDMLEYAIGRTDCSRLSCQMKLSQEMNGMELRVHS